MKTRRSEGLYSEATKVMVGGVSSPVRAFRAVGAKPLFLEKGKGDKIWDADGNVYLDYVLSWGPLILGHSHPAVVAAIVENAKLGTSFGAPTIPELELAKKVCALMPSIEQVRFVNSGTEAAMSALRLARAYTKRNRFVKFEGCYHGHSDSFLTRAGSGMATFDIPSSPGVPEATEKGAITLEFNNLDEVEESFRRSGDEIAAVFVEPVAGNMGVVPPSPGFLKGLRKLSSEHGALLVFDEVITGFRIAPGGAQQLYGIEADLTCLGKIIGGGLPVGAYGGKREVMSLLAPEGPVYQAGTLSGNPLAMAAGLATISALDRTAYARLERSSARLEKGLLESAAASKLPVTIKRVGSMMGLFFGGREISSFKDVRSTGHSLYPRFHRVMLQNHVYFPPSPFESFFLSTKHSIRDVDLTVSAAREAFKAAARGA